MAYPTVSAPYGFQPINRVDGMPYAGATRQINISGSYNTAIYKGDLVVVVTGGTLEKYTGTTTGSPVGVFMGVQYVNAQSQTVQAQYYPGTSVTNAVAYVVDDPMAAFKVAVTDGSSVMSSAARAAARCAFRRSGRTGLDRTQGSRPIVRSRSSRRCGRRFPRLPPAWR